MSTIPNNAKTAGISEDVLTIPSADVLKIFSICFILWAIPVGSIWLSFGYESTLTQIGLFFTKAAFVTFGGAYAVLSYITDFAVSSGWLSTEQMLVGLGLAESTPGPLETSCSSSLHLSATCGRRARRPSGSLHTTIHPPFASPTPIQRPPWQAYPTWYLVPG